MRLYEIEERLLEVYENLLDSEGQVNQEAVAEFEELTIEREKKIENTALYVKQLNYEVQALQNEKKNIDQRIRHKKNTADFLKQMLEGTLNGKKFETARTRVTFRNSTRVEVDPDFINYAQGRGLVDYIKTDITQRPKKDEIKKALQAGEQLEHCRLVKARNTIIK